MKRVLFALLLMAVPAVCLAARPLKEDTAVTVIVGPFVDDTGAAVTGATIASIDCNLYKNDGTKVDVTLAASGTDNDAAHVADGYYSLELTTTDTNTPGYLRITFEISGSLIFHEDFDVLPANIYDSWYSTDKLQVDIVQNGGASATSIASDAGDAKAAAEAAQAAVEDGTSGLAALKVLIDALPQTGDLLTLEDITTGIDTWWKAVSYWVQSPTGDTKFTNHATDPTAGSNPTSYTDAPTPGTATTP